MLATANPADMASSIWSATLLMLTVPLLGGLAAAVGAIAWARIRRSGGKLRGSPLAVSALVIGSLLVVASPFLLAASFRANLHREYTSPTEGRKTAETSAGKAETASLARTEVPVARSVDYNPRAFTWWMALRSMGVIGMFVLVIGLGVLASIVIGIASDKLVWMPVAGGLLGLLAGIIGTIIGMSTAFSKIASAGGAANPADLGEGISASLVTSVLGTVALLIGILGTVGLVVFHGYRREAAARAAT